MNDQTRDWACDAYGPDIDELLPEGSPHCFFEQVERCGDERTCRQRLNVERWRIWQHLCLLAVTGDQIARDVLVDVETPFNLLQARIFDEDGSAALSPRSDRAN